jgi:hypothetical protein
VLVLVPFIVENPVFVVVFWFRFLVTLMRLCKLSWTSWATVLYRCVLPCPSCASAVDRLPSRRFNRSRESSMERLAQLSALHDRSLAVVENLVRVRALSGDAPVTAVFIEGLEICCWRWMTMQQRSHHFLLALSTQLDQSEPFRTTTHAPFTPTPPQRNLLLTEVSTSLVSSHPRTRALLRMARTGARPSSENIVTVVDYRDMLINVASGILRRLFLPLVYLHPQLELAFFDSPPISADVLSSSSLFSSYCLGYAKPAPTCTATVSTGDIEADPLFQSFLDSYVEVLKNAQQLGNIDDVTFSKQFYRVCDYVEAEKEVKPSEEKLHEAILDAILSEAAKKKERVHKKQ